MYTFVVGTIVFFIAWELGYREAKQEYQVVLTVKGGEP